MTTLCPPRKLKRSMTPVPKIDLDRSYEAMLEERKKRGNVGGPARDQFGKDLLAFVTRTVRTVRSCWRGLDYQNLDDIVSEAVLRAWKVLPQWEKKSSLTTFLHTIVRNSAMDAFREITSRYSEVQEIFPDNLVSRDNPHPRLLVSELFAQITPDEAALTRMKMDGLTDAEIAEALQVPYNTVTSRWKRLLVKFRALSSR